MKWSFASVGLVAAGLVGVVIILLFQNLTVNNEEDYYLLKEITEAAMIDAVDLKAYRDGIGWDGVTEDTDPESMHCMEGIPGTIRIIEEKFVESFVRRFASSAQLNRKYKIIINDIDECPPKVTVTLVATEEFSFLSMFNVEYNSGEDIVNVLTGILENKTPDEY